MKKMTLLLSVLLASSTVFAQVMQRDAVVLACREAQRVRFHFETSCKDEFNRPIQVTQNAYLFKGLDISGDCGIQVAIHKITGHALSKVSCN